MFRSAIMRSVVATLLGALIVAVPSAASEITPGNVLRIMNAERAKAGLQLLRSEARLDAAAADRIRHMEEEQFWAHTAPDGTAPFVWLSHRGYRYRNAGENLARGFDTAELLVEAWMESPGHRANILDPDYREAGIAVIDGYTTGPGSGRSIVILFGAERGE